MALKSLDHITINTAKPKETVEFYTKLLGMRIGCARHSTGRAIGSMSATIR